MSDFDFEKLQSSEHMLKWLADKPYGVILESITDMLSQQIAGSNIVSFSVTSQPEWLTGVLPAEGSSEAIVTRVGCAFEFEMNVQAVNNIHHLTGVFSWVGNNLHDRSNSQQRTWLDMDKTLDIAGVQGELKDRIYKL